MPSKFVAVDKFPIGRTGKMDAAALRAGYAEFHSGDVARRQQLQLREREQQQVSRNDGAATSGAEMAAPGGSVRPTVGMDMGDDASASSVEDSVASAEIEEIVAQVWREVLGVVRLRMRTMMMMMIMMMMMLTCKTKPHHV